MIPQLTLRKPEEVMKLSRLGSLHQSRISFMRVLLRRLASENWRFDNQIGILTMTVLGMPPIAFMALKEAIRWLLLPMTFLLN